MLCLELSTTSTDIADVCGTSLSSTQVLHALRIVVLVRTILEGLVCRHVRLLNHSTASQVELGMRASPISLGHVDALI